MDYLEKFITYLTIEKDYATHTFTAYEKALIAFENYCKKELDHTAITTVDYAHIRAWIVSMVEKGLSHQSVNTKIAALRSFYKYLLKIEVRKDNPLQGHQPLKTKKRIPVPFSTGELEKIVTQQAGENFALQRDVTLISLLYATGIRRAELIGLQEMDVDLKRGHIKVLGKRNKERYVPLITEVIKDLERYLTLKKQENFREKTLFVTDKGNKIYETFVYRVVKKYLSEVSSKEKNSPHMLRHTFATHLVENGADLNAVKDLLGHSSLAATQVYVHTSLKGLKKSYQKAHPRGQKK